MALAAGEGALELRQLRYLIAIVDYGSISRASSQLNVVQPALSQQIANLEAELGAPLLVRSSRGVTPTEAGLRLYRRARTILGQVDQASREASRPVQAAEIAEPVSIGLPTSTATILAVPLIRRVGLDHPEIRLRLVEGLSGHLLEMILRNRLDMAIQFRSEPTTGLLMEPLLDEELFHISWEPDRAGQPITLAELAAWPISLPGQPHAMRSVIDRACQEKGVALNVVADVDSLPALRELAVSGYAATILPNSALADFSDRGSLFCRPIVDPSIRRRLSLCRGESVPDSAAVATVRKVVRTLARELVDEGAWTGVELLNDPETSDRI